jgi:hypothetical protein
MQGMGEGEESGEPGRPTDRGWDVVKGMSAFGQAVGAIVRAFDPTRKWSVHRSSWKNVVFAVGEEQSRATATIRQTVQWRVYEFTS